MLATEHELFHEEYSLVVVLMFLVVYGGVAEREKEERETLGVSAGN